MFYESQRKFVEINSCLAIFSYILRPTHRLIVSDSGSRLLIVWLLNSWIILEIFQFHLSLFHLTSPKVFINSRNAHWQTSLSNFLRRHLNSQFPSIDLGCLISLEHLIFLSFVWSKRFLKTLCVTYTPNFESFFEPSVRSVLSFHVIQPFYDPYAIPTTWPFAP